MMICENCNANVPKVYQGADGRKYCCPHCLFNPLGCRCQFGELGVAEHTDYGQFDDDDEDDDSDEYESSRTCADCWHTEEFCECGELPPEAKHDDDCPCKGCQPSREPDRSSMIECADCGYGFTPQLDGGRTICDDCIENRNYWEEVDFEEAQKQAFESTPADDFNSSRA